MYFLNIFCISTSRPKKKKVDTPIQVELGVEPEVSVPNPFQVKILKWNL